MQVLKKALDALGYKYEEASAGAPASPGITYLRIKHGSHIIVALDAPMGALLMYLTDLSPEDTDALAKAHESVRRELVVVLARESLHGRGGYQLLWDDPETQTRLRRWSVEQRIVIADVNPATLQRLVDAIQELVVVGLRATTVLGQAFGNTKSAAPSTDFHAGMYH